MRSAASAVPDPRVAGPSIFFDSRLDSAQPASAKAVRANDPILQAMGDK